MSSVLLRAPQPSDAEAWFDFLVAQQAKAYAGIVPADFATGQDRKYRDAWVPELAAAFASPGTARRVVAELNGAIVGIASILDGPQDWEIAVGLVPSPAGRELERLYLDPSQHGTGLAKAMFTAVDEGEDLYLWLIDGNERAHRFYLRLGFTDVDEQHAAGNDWGGVGMHRMARLS